VPSANPEICLSALERNDMTAVEAFIERLGAAPPNAPFDISAIREEIHDLYKGASSREREALLAMLRAAMDMWKRRTDPSGHAEIEGLRKADYNLLLITECTDNAGHVVPSRLLAVCEREIAGGRMQPNDKTYELAKAGVAVLERPSPPPKKPGLLRRLFG
jgi:hypothetical protein